jgi:hypothetical protein
LALFPAYVYTRTEPPGADAAAPEQAMTTVVPLCDMAMVLLDLLVPPRLKSALPQAGRLASQLNMSGGCG